MPGSAVGLGGCGLTEFAAGPSSISGRPGLKAAGLLRTPGPGQVPGLAIAVLDVKIRPQSGLEIRRGRFAVRLAGLRAGLRLTGVLPRQHGDVQKRYSPIGKVSGFRRCPQRFLR